MVVSIYIYYTIMINYEKFGIREDSSAAGTFD